MAQLPQAYNPADHEAQQSVDIMPACEYPMIISADEMKPTKAGNGSYLALTLEIIDGTFKGRKIWANLNLDNPNATAVEIAQRELKSICDAVGFSGVIDDTAVLHNRPFLGKLKIKPASMQYEERNEMEGYARLNGAPPAPSQPYRDPVQPKAAQPNNYQGEVTTPAMMDAQNAQAAKPAAWWDTAKA
jgi:hypothetical protein